MGVEIDDCVDKFNSRYTGCVPRGKKKKKGKETTFSHSAQNSNSPKSHGFRTPPPCKREREVIRGANAKKWTAMIFRNAMSMIRETPLSRRARARARACKRVTNVIRARILVYECADIVVSGYFIPTETKTIVTLSALVTRVIPVNPQDLFLVLIIIQTIIRSSIFSDIFPSFPKVLTSVTQLQE